MKILKIFTIIFFCIFFVGCKNKEESHYLIFQPDGTYKNEELFEYFLENSNNKLDCNLVLLELTEDNNQLIHYILYKNGVFNIENYINEQILDSYSFKYLKEIVYNNFTYYFLTNNKDFNEEDIQNYLNGQLFEALEIYSKKND